MTGFETIGLVTRQRLYFIDDFDWKQKGFVCRPTLDVIFFDGCIFVGTQKLYRTDSSDIHTWNSLLTNICNSEFTFCKFFTWQLARTRPWFVILKGYIGYYFCWNPFTITLLRSHIFSLKVIRIKIASNIFEKQI